MTRSELFIVSFTVGGVGGLIGGSFFPTVWGSIGGGLLAGLLFWPVIRYAERRNQ